jgi:hypothetical protein
MTDRLSVSRSLAAAVFAAGSLVGCGNSTPAPTTPVPVTTPPVVTTPAPVADPRAYGHICPYGSGNGPQFPCPHTQGTLNVQVNRALDQVLQERPELFNFNSDIPIVLDHDAYIKAVVQRLNTMDGVCAINDGEEIGVKNTNAFNEQWNIWYSKGLVRRTYVTTCSPAAF